MTTLLNVISNCKDDLIYYSITLNSLNSIKDRIRLISVIRCEDNLIDDFKKVASPFKNKKIIFNSDNGLYNAINIGLREIDKKLPFLCLHSGDLIFDETKEFLIQLLNKPMSKYSLFLFNTYLFNMNNQNFSDLIKKPKNSSLVKNLKRREPANFFLRTIYLYFSYNCHQSIIYSPEISNIEFNENVGIVSDLFYNHKVYKITRKFVRFNKFLSLFNKNGLAANSSITKKLKSRFLIILKYPQIIFDQRFLKGLISLFIKYLIK